MSTFLKYISGFLTLLWLVFIFVFFGTLALIILPFRDDPFKNKMV